MKKRTIYRMIFLLFVLVLTKLFVISPIENKKMLLEKEKDKISQEIENAQELKKQTETLKNLEEDKKRETIFEGKDDVIEIQNIVNNIVEIESIENSIEIDSNGQEISNINVKFVGTYEQIFKVVDSFKSRGIDKMLKSVSISKIETTTKTTESNNADNAIKLNTSEKNKEQNNLEKSERNKELSNPEKEKIKTPVSQKSYEDKNMKKDKNIKFECIFKISKN